MRTIRIERRKKFQGCAIPVEIFVDGQCHAQVKNGAAENVSIGDGKHRLQAECDALDKHCRSNVVLIDEGESDLCFDLNVSSALAGLKLELSKKTSDGKTEGKKKFSGGIFFLLLIVFFPAAIIYWLKSK